MKLSNKLTLYSFFLLLLLLSGCGAALNPYHENFNCQGPDDSGKCVDTPSAYAEAAGINPLVKEEKANTERDVDGARLERLAALLQEPQTPMIIPPRILRVLILPHKGDGDLFMARYAYLQVESAQWVLSDIDEEIEPE